MPLFDKGYNLVLPDMQGYGYNDSKGDFEWSAHVQNLVDTTKYASRKFNGKILLGGGSMGGPLAYAAACNLELEKFKLDALLCWCLWDFADEEFMIKETKLGRFMYPAMKLAEFISYIANFKITCVRL
jgi:pimeloyl-ACP methyl ester carboxylesterase